MIEHQYAVLFANWLRANNYIFHHSPNETFTKFHNVRRKNTLEGVSKGFPDYCIILKRGSLLFIELKKARGKRGGLNGSKISPEQTAWISQLGNIDNVGAFFAHGYEEAKRIVMEMEKI
ncbi:VRR-NUC domain-containing protein [Candidatus Gracilibacteria bacterium]|nr:VRR-NUC domain-containing protein [Candidatus Gracilibacteria bacterium]